MEKLLLIVIFTIFNSILFIEAAPKSLDANIKTRVRYDGAQLWSVNLASDGAQKVIADLEANFGYFRFLRFRFVLL